MEYPLYDKLVQDALTLSNNASLDMKALSRTVQKMTTNPDYIVHAKEIQALILHHSSLHNNADLNTYPCKKITKDKGIIYQLEKLPSDLVYIIQAYLIMFSR